MKTMSKAYGNVNSNASVNAIGDSGNMPIDSSSFSKDVLGSMLKRLSSAGAFGGGYTGQLVTNDYHLYESMDEMEKRLKMFGFIRVHQSFLVNASHIRSINNYILTLDTGYEIKIPKARYKKVREERSLFLGKSL